MLAARLRGPENHLGIGNECPRAQRPSPHWHTGELPRTLLVTFPLRRIGEASGVARARRSPPGPPPAPALNLNLLGTPRYDSRGGVLIHGGGSDSKPPAPVPFPHPLPTGARPRCTSLTASESMPASSEYWCGARDLAIVELNELTKMGAPARVREMSLKLLLGVAQLGALPLTEELAAFMPLARPAQPARQPRRVSRTSTSRARSSPGRPP